MALLGGANPAVLDEEAVKAFNAVKAEFLQLQGATEAEPVSVQAQVVAGIKYIFEVKVGDETVPLSVWRKLDGTYEICT